MTRVLGSLFVGLITFLMVLNLFGDHQSLSLAANSVDAARAERIAQDGDVTEEPAFVESTAEPIPTETPTSEPTAIPTVIPTLEPTATATVIPMPEPTSETTPEASTPESTAELTDALPPEATSETTSESTPEAEATETLVDTEITPEATDPVTAIPPQFDVRAICEEQGVKFVIANVGGEMTSPSTYTLILDEIGISSEATPRAPATEFMLLENTSMDVAAGFGLPRLLIGEAAFQPDEPCGAPVAPALSVDAVCALETGVTFTITNAGGAMAAEQAFSVRTTHDEIYNGIFQLNENEAMNFEAGYGQPTLSTGEIVSTVDTPCAAPVTVNGIVWNDADGNGVREDSETGIGGISIHLTDEAGAVMSSVTTLDGAYSFNMLPAGTYSIQADSAAVSEDYVLSYPADAIGIVTINALPDGIYSADFGFIIVPTASVSGTVWLETTNYGVRDADELGIDGVMVELVDSNGVVVATATVDATTGVYQTATVPAGNYTVRLDTSTLFTPNAISWNSDSTLDYETPITLSSHQSLSGIDFGILGTF